MDAKTGLSHEAAEGAQSEVEHEKAAYAQGRERPLGSYAAIIVTYGATVAGLSALVRRSDKRLPDRLALADVALLSVATHKLSRLLAKDPVTSPLRAPFTRFAGRSGPAELEEQTRGTGPQKAVGELVTCPFCLGQWVATAFAFGLVLAPKPTRLAASVLTTLTAADFLQFAYAAAEQAVGEAG
jgi:hypothetical protein